MEGPPYKGILTCFSVCWFLKGDSTSVASESKNVLHRQKQMPPLFEQRDLKLNMPRKAETLGQLISLHFPHACLEEQCILVSLQRPQGSQGLLRVLRGSVHTLAGSQTRQRS